jgi:hypothetical protein
MYEMQTQGVENTKRFWGRMLPRPPPPLLQTTPHQSFCHQQQSVIYPSPFCGSYPLTDEFLKNALSRSNSCIMPYHIVYRSK